MIEIEINGDRRNVEPASLEQLRAQTLGTVPDGHGVSLLRVNGEEFSADRWDELELRSVREVQLCSAPLDDIARSAITETREWISRICGVLEAIASDYRAGREEQANSRLADAADALHVLIHLLHGICSHVDLGDAQRARDLGEEWHDAERALSDAVDAAASDLAWRDPVALADHTGHALPRTLRRFQGLLQEMSA